MRVESLGEKHTEIKDKSVRSSISPSRSRVSRSHIVILYSGTPFTIIMFLPSRDITILRICSTEASKNKNQIPDSKLLINILGMVEIAFLLGN